MWVIIASLHTVAGVHGVGGGGGGQGHMSGASVFKGATRRPGSSCCPLIAMRWQFEHGDVYVGLA